MFTRMLTAKKKKRDTMYLKHDLSNIYNVHLHIQMKQWNEMQQNGVTMVLSEQLKV